ncbi:hypothetical protein FRC96_04230 [Lujinxingia vulgaris]|uniref:DUF3857 domain-containing protein n=1 Tax=Lujinxingia vulgaris TaxID=2600176 RepID=A0A5C6XDH9_9DELT|nr:tetratricopeptide repeat protein [Lujinxingia vulgaris]TXD41203.1 hypothetical protein FRC96_04230 [Lujinxingia vulgaris]
MKSASRMLRALLLAMMAAWVMSCASASPTPSTDWRFEAGSPAAATFEAWLHGEEVDTSEDAAGVEALLTAGESALWEGDKERAFEIFSTMLREHPAHPLQRYAALRLVELVDEVVEGPQRLEAWLGQVRYEGQGVLTQVELSRLAGAVAHARWERSDVRAPFALRSAGVPMAWRVSPLMSPWRLLDVDTVYSPEQGGWLGDQYRSPQIARPSPANWRPTRRVALGRAGQGLGLGESGVYYLEATLQVAGPDAQEVAIFGDFSAATKVWVGSTPVLEHREEDYEAGRYVRRLRVKPGTHRVLVKMAYEAGYRDRLDLRVVPAAGAVMGEERVRFVETPPVRERPEVGPVEVMGEVQRSWEVEPLHAVARAPSQAGSSGLWWAAVSALEAGETQAFETIVGALASRSDGELPAPAELLRAEQVLTRWDLPGDLRDAEALMAVRRAHTLRPQLLSVLVALEQRLRRGGSDEERRRVLEAARDAAIDGQGELRDLGPLKAWAGYVAGQGVRAVAEEAWREVLAVAPTDCEAAKKLQDLYALRSYAPHPSEISEGWEACPALYGAWVQARGDAFDERLAWLELQAARQPLEVSRQVELARFLRGVGQEDEALEVLAAARKAQPWETRLWLAEADLLLSLGRTDEARAALSRDRERYGSTARVDWMIHEIDGELPLQDAMPDGLAAARAEFARAPLAPAGEGQEVGLASGGEPGAMALDEAYYVLDYAARRYFPDGSSWTLTHTVVRLMTRGAIDRYAEVELPRGARQVLVRTIKASGAVRVPEEVAGKGTLSMPGLEPGDMIEVAYLQHDGPGTFRTHIEGMRFFFRMADISTRHSEYVILGADDLGFIAANGAPGAEAVEMGGVKGVRFVATDQRRPTPEPLTVSSEEFLPWVQEYRVGVEGGAIESDRRYVVNALMASDRVGPGLKAQAARWLGRPLRDTQKATDAEVRELFAQVSEAFAQPSPLALTTDANHAVLLGRGSPLVVLCTLYQRLGVDAEIYLARGQEQPDARHPVGDFNRYRRGLLRVVLPESEAVVWLEAAGPDAMFGAVDGDVEGQPALCVSCADYEEVRVEGDAARRPSRAIAVEGEVDDEGTLRAVATATYGGMRAVRVRGALRARSDEADRDRYIDAIAQELFSGARVEAYEVQNASEVDQPLRLTITLSREGFARQAQDGWVIDTTLFADELASIYASRDRRQLPMRVGYERYQTYALRLRLPEGANLDEATLRATDLNLEGANGSYTRRSRLEGGELRVDTEVALPRQRVMPEEYEAFRRWAIAVEQSAGLVVRY